MKKLLTFIALTAMALPAFAQVSGTVFRDFNANGMKDNSPTFNEPFVQGVTVTVYNSAGTPTVTTTNASGAYSFTGLTLPLRIEFSGLQLGDYASKSGTANASSVQFYTAASSTANFAVNYPEDYCQASPYITLSTFYNGNPLGGGTSANRGAIVSFLYSDATDITTPVPPSLRQDGTTALMGAVYGLAYHKTAKKVFSAAFLKRHVGWGPLGIGGLYVTDYSTGGAGVTSSFINLTTLGVILLPATLPTAAPTALLTNSGATSRNLPNTLDAPSNDADAFTWVGKAGMGDMDISEDGNKLYIANLADRNIIVVDITNYIATGTVPTSTEISSITVPLPTCSNGVARLFGLKLYKGVLYVGATCTGENAGATISDVNISVKALNLSDNTWTTVVAPYTLNYTKGAAQGSISTTWNTWTDNDLTYDFQGNYTSGTTTPAAFQLTPGSRPAPLLSDIEIDAQGNMILGIMDRSGHQWGFANYSKTGTAIRMDWRIGGDVLKAGKCTASSTTWTIETNGGICGTTGSAVQRNAQGPGGGEFFYQEAGYISGGTPLLGHKEVSMGSLAIQMGKEEVLMTGMDPIVEFSGGLLFLNNTTGETNKRAQIYSDPYGGTILGTSGKANGLGDMETLCNAAPIEIGNRVWFDADADGIQDAGENGIEGVNVQLKQGTTVLATKTTDAKGSYYFDNYAAALTANATSTITNTNSDARQNGTDVSTTPTGLLFNSRYIGLQFANLNIPTNATITAATLRFTSSASSGTISNVIIKGHKVSNSAAWSTGATSSDISSRYSTAPTTASTTWTNTTAWTTNASTAAQTTPDLSAVVNEIIGQSGWASNNPITFLINAPANSTGATAYDVTGLATAGAILSLTYTYSGTNPLSPNTTYTISVPISQTPLTGYQTTTANVGGAGQPDLRDNDATLNATAAEIVYTTGSAGQNNHSLDVGFMPPAGSIGNYVWNDTNANSVNDELATAGINGVNVELWNNDTNLFVTSTPTADDASGNAGYYNFVITASGNYYIKFPTASPTGKPLVAQTATAATDGNSDALPSNGLSPVFNIDINGTGTAKDNNTIDAGYGCPNGCILMTVTKTK